MGVWCLFLASVFSFHGLGPTYCTLSSHLRGFIPSYFHEQSGSTNGLRLIFFVTLTMQQQCAMSTASMLMIHLHPTYYLAWHYL